jgi:hypothetical protein
VTRILAGDVTGRRLQKEAADAEMAQWSGEGLSQVDFMQKDECILLDMQDNVIGEERCGPRPYALGFILFHFPCMDRASGKFPMHPARRRLARDLRRQFALHCSVLLRLYPARAAASPVDGDDARDRLAKLSPFLFALAPLPLLPFAVFATGPAASRLAFAGMLCSHHRADMHAWHTLPHRTPVVQHSRRESRDRHRQ